MAQTWESTRKHARALEGRLESKMTAYSKLATQISSSSASSSPRASSDRLHEAEEGVGGYKLMEEEIEELLEKLSGSIDTLTSLLDSPDIPPSTSMMHAASRHREVLDDYRRDFVRTRTNVESAMARSNLLGSIRKDINAYKSSLPQQDQSRTDSLLTERGRIDSSNRMLDDTLSQAYATRDDFAQQRTAIANINSRVGGVLSTLPGINSLLGMIKSRRRRDTVILGTVVGICTLILLWYIGLV